jgi:GTP-binding protein HflX
LIEKKLGEEDTSCNLLLPYSEGSILNMLNEAGKIHNTEYLPEGVKINVLLSAKEMAKYQEYII